MIKCIQKMALLQLFCSTLNQNVHYCTNLDFPLHMGEQLEYLDLVNALTSQNT